MLSMEAERTRLAVKLVTHLDEEPEETFYFRFDYALSVEELEAAVQEWGEREGGTSDLWEINQRTTFTNWGASAVTLDYIIQIFNDGTGELFWLLLGAWLDRKLGRQTELGLPDEEAARNDARYAIVIGEPTEKWAELEEVSASFDRDTPSRTFEFKSPSHRYEVRVRRTPGGGNSVASYKRTALEQ